MDTIYLVIAGLFFIPIFLFGSDLLDLFRLVIEINKWVFWFFIFTILMFLVYFLIPIINIYDFIVIDKWKH